MSIYSLCVAILIFLMQITSLQSFALSSSEKEVDSFLFWLKRHETEFAQCQPKKEADFYILCDQTKVPVALITSLFKMSSKELVSFVQEKGIKLEIFCQQEKKEDKQAAFQEWCKKEITRQYFKDVSALHGQYIPEEKTIALYSTAYNGSLIHEYLHSLQSENTNPVFDKVYKKERNQVQKNLMAEFDQITARSKEIKNTPEGKKEMLNILMQAQNFTGQMMKFGFYQRLIDERNLFRLYIVFGSEFGAKPEDIQLAKKNMGFLCKEKQLGALLTQEDCLAKNTAYEKETSASF